MYYYYQINYKRPNNINTHVHVGRKNHVVYRFHYLLPPMCERKILEHPETNKNDQFSKKTYIHKQKNFNF